jgi:hypothetical protein
MRAHYVQIDSEESRIVCALMAKIASKDERKRFAAQENPFQRWLKLSARSQSKYFLLTALTLSDWNPLPLVVKVAATQFENRPDVLRHFIRAIARGANRPFIQRDARILILWWGGFRSRMLPPLSRWNSAAACELMKCNGEPGLDVRTYRQAVRRLGLRQELPILVQKITKRPGDFTVTFTAEGYRWLEENRLLPAATQNVQKTSHDKSMRAAFTGRQWTRLNQRREIAAQKLPP